MLMKRVWGHLLVGLSLLAGAAAAVPACVHNDSTLFIQDVLAPPIVSAGQQCTFTSDPTQPFITSGGMDLALTSTYNATFLLANQMVPESNSQQLQTETSTIHVEGAVIKITDAAGSQLNSYTRDLGGTVYPASGSVPGYAPMSADIVDSTTAASLGGQLTNGNVVRVVTYTYFFGHTLGGKYVESDTFEFPVDVCFGCLVAFSETDINPNYPFPNCVGTGTATGGGATVPVPCKPGQDYPIDCSACRTISPVCNPNAPAQVADAGAG
jgi:hypothetical protein